MPKLHTKFAGRLFPDYELKREIGHKLGLGWEQRLKYSLYSNLRPCNSTNSFTSTCSAGEEGAFHGGIFNLEFSPNGNQLVAACENRAVLVFDPLTKKMIHNVSDAHTTCVNGVKFLDDRLFATCSDDKTVALWDVRHLSKRIVRLTGHNHWVKNIEYSSDEGMLITSGFDGRILGWDINRYVEESPAFTELFSMKGLMRTRLTPDLTKLVICTTAGYMIVIHDLSLKHLAADLSDFMPNTYRLMQISNAALEQPTSVSRHLYSRRNRIELISDFPAGNDAEIIHSLQVHPQGWCVLSRNTSTADSSEWTCVHDIQDRDLKTSEPVPESKSADSSSHRCYYGLDGSDEDGNVNNNRNTDQSGQEERENDNSNRNSQGERETNPNQGGQGERETNSNQDDQGERETNSNRSSQGERGNDLRFSFTVSPRMEISLRQSRSQETQETERENEPDSETGRGDDLDVHLRFHSPDSYVQHIELRRSRELRGTNRSPWIPIGGRRNRFHNDFRLRRRRETNFPSFYIDSSEQSSILVLRTGTGASTIVVPLNRDQHGRNQNQRIPGNPRLTHYIEEPNKGKGFIKELCFSSDGRVVCSPYDRGVRLLAFDDKCSELSHCVPKEPQKLQVVTNFFTHSKGVVSTKFSPNDCLLVSGCLNGKLVWYQPVL